jgi:hypothetical protein
MKEGSINQIIDLIKTRHTTLFLGAGSSIPLGGPSGGDLTKFVKKQFSDVKYLNENNFFDVCKDIIDSGKYSRIDLQKIIFKHLNGLFPDSKIEKLVNLPWKCIFTTNYDMVIERIPDDNLKNKKIRPVIENNPKIKFNNLLLLNYVKIFGSIDIEYRNEGYPILLRSEHSTSFERRKSYYSILADCIREGPIVFLGYSFKDDLVFDIFDELVLTTGINSLRESYAILPNTPDEKTIRFFEKFNIIYVKGTLDDFIQQTDEQLADYNFDSVYTDKIVHISGFPIEIPIATENQCRQHFDFLDQNFIESSYKNIKNFFTCEDLSYYPYQQNWDFEREVYSFDSSINPHLCKEFGPKVQDGLKKHIFKNYLSPKPETNSITILTGPAGCGKTVVLKRLAFDWYSRGQPVIFINPKGPTFDYFLLGSFIEYLEGFIKTHKLETQLSRPRVLIICDNCGSLLQDFKNMFKHLTSRGRLITVILADREKEIRNLKNYYLTYTIPEHFSNNELKNFTHYLIKQKLVETEAEILPLIENPKFNESFFALMYSIVHESKKPLNEIINDQYIKLNGQPKKIYEYVCLFNNYHLNFPENLLVRSSVDSFIKFRKNILKNELNKIIFPIDVEDGEVDYRVHHPIIAEKTIDLFSIENKVQKINEILMHVYPQYSHEVNAIEYLLEKEIEPESKEKAMTIKMKRDLFKTACSFIESRSLYHHYALLEMRDPGKDFDNAECLLKKAISMEGHEPIQNIYTSYGKLFMKKGHQYCSDGDSASGIKNYDVAIRYYIQGRSKRHFNEYSYHGQIVVLSKKATLTNDNIEKIQLLSDALDLCEEAINVLDFTDQKIFIEEKAKIFEKLNQISKFEEIIQILAKKYGSAAGYRIKALKKYYEIFSSKSEIKIKSVENLLEIVDLGLDVDPKDNGLLTLKVKIILRIYPDDEDKQFEILKNWYNYSERQNLRFLLQYGILLFKKESYKKSKDVFNELEIISEDDITRSYLKKIILFTKNKKIQEFSGVVTFVDMYNRTGYIKCTSLPNCPTELKFFPKYAAGKGDHVIFNIGFNFRGPTAESVVQYS